MFKILHAPPALILSSISLLIFGLVMITSASFNIAQTTFCVPLHYFWQQFAYATIWISLAILIITYVPMRICQHFNMHLLLLSWCLFSYLLHFPVVEPMKLLIILYVANYLSHDPLNGLIKPIIILCLSPSKQPPLSFLFITTFHVLPAIITVSGSFISSSLPNTPSPFPSLPVLR